MSRRNISKAVSKLMQFTIVIWLGFNYKNLKSGKKTIAKKLFMKLSILLKENK
jgi:hypothetical protein